MVRRSSAAPGVARDVGASIDLLNVLLVFRLVELGILKGVVDLVVLFDLLVCPLVVPLPVPAKFTVLLIALVLRIFSMLPGRVLGIVFLLVLGMWDTLIVTMYLLCILLHELRNTVIVLGQWCNLLLMHVFGSAVSCTPMSLQLIRLFRLCGMVIRLLWASIIPAVGLVSKALNRLALSC